MEHSINLFYMHLFVVSIWWIFLGTLQEGKIQLILSTILLCNQILSLWVIKKVHKEKMGFKFSYSILYIIWQVTLLEITLNGESQNIWNIQINTFLLMVNQRNLKSLLRGNFKVFVRLFLPVYGFTRFLISLFLSKDFLSFYIIISFVFLIFNNNYNLERKEKKQNEVLDGKDSHTH